mmetsp:Transcript_9396/g.17930  ORF Transcript_9396/g.17930 Transcript_9396/m.17930 type:complete len:101 (+) Transcript_9396:1056-1358(+)
MDTLNVGMLQWTGGHCPIALALGSSVGYHQRPRSHGHSLGCGISRCTLCIVTVSRGTLYFDGMVDMLRVKRLIHLCLGVWLGFCLSACVSKDISVSNGDD